MYMPTGWQAGRWHGAEMLLFLLLLLPEPSGQSMHCWLACSCRLHAIPGVRTASLRLSPDLVCSVLGGRLCSAAMWWLRQCSNQGIRYGRMSRLSCQTKVQLSACSQLAVWCHMHIPAGLPHQVRAWCRAVAGEGGAARPAPWQGPALRTAAGCNQAVHACPALAAALPPWLDGIHRGLATSTARHACMSHACHMHGAWHLFKSSAVPLLWPRPQSAQWAAALRAQPATPTPPPLACCAGGTCAWPLHAAQGAAVGAAQACGLDGLCRAG